MALILKSSAFAGGGEIPKRHTCEGDDASPPLAWSGAPAGTKTFASTSSGSVRPVFRSTADFRYSNPSPEY